MMARNIRGQQTLGELLNNKVFLENDKPFVIIFDKQDVLVDFLSNSQQQVPEDFKLLSIIASQSPSEFIDREVIVADFDEEVGWYRHKWIIHVHGEHTGEIVQAKSFFYYQLLGEVFILDDFMDLLMHPSFNLIKSKESTSVIDRYPVINRLALKYLVDLPLSCIISEGKTFQESLAWLMLFTSDIGINPSQATRSPAWASLASNRIPCTHIPVLLNLIFLLPPLNVPQLEESSRKTLNNYFSAMLLDFGLKKFALTDEWFENLTQIIRLVFQYGKPPLQGKSSEKKKGGTLDAFLPTPQDGTTPPESTILLFQDMMNDWIKNADKILVTRFQQWAFLLRKNQTPPTLSEDNLTEHLNLFSFTGIVDINIATYLLKVQEKELSEANLWLTKVDDVIKKREKLWEKATRVWWTQRKLFNAVNNNQAISVKELWQFTRQIGQLLSYNIQENKKWADLEGDAWEIESLHVAINDPVFDTIYSGSDYFSYFTKLIEKMNEMYQQCNKNINNAFTINYLDYLQEKGQNFYENFNTAVWKYATDTISKENLIGFIFCDAMRQDVARELMDVLESKQKENQANIVANKSAIEQIRVLGILPSITNLGWNLALRQEDKLQAKLSGDKLVSGFATGTATKVLNDPSAREERISALFANAGKKVCIYHIDPKNFNTDIDLLHEKITGDQGPIVPIMWYDKIDNHEFTLQDFLKQKTLILSELGDFIFKLHETGIKDIFIIADHGFIFTKNDKLLKTKPDGIGPLHKRHCISRHVFVEYDANNFPDWLIFPSEQLSFSIDSSTTDIRSIILPKDDSIFKKSKIEGQFFIHGGLSFQECDLLHFISHCEFKPMVEIESIEPVDHGDPQMIHEKPSYILKNIKGTSSNYLQIQVQTRKKGDKEVKLRPITFKVTVDDPRIHIDHEQEFTLISGKKQNFMLTFDKSVKLSNIVVHIKNEKNQTIMKKEFGVSPPVYDVDLSF